MHGITEETYNKILKIINRYSDIKFKLFGSRAKGKERANSDIDIAVFGEMEEQEKFNIKNDFDLIDIPYKIDLVFIEEITKKELIDSILKEGVDF